jgi:hypothetical protein
MEMDIEKDETLKKEESDDDDEDKGLGESKQKFNQTANPGYEFFMTSYGAHPGSKKRKGGGLVLLNQGYGASKSATFDNQGLDLEIISSVRQNNTKEGLKMKI